MVGLKPAKVVSEATRERETFRYDPSLFAGFVFHRDGRPPTKNALRTAADSALTGLAQLGTHQTHTERAFISFFDSSHQYVVAEATPLMRIAPNLPSEECPEPLLLCGTAIPRNQGTCEHVLHMRSSPNSTDPSELPLSFIPNLAEDPRFSSRPYCHFGRAGQFYAGVPIRTPRGINIGVYCVMGMTQPSSWDERSTQSLKDVSLAITDYLELKRSKHEARNHARVNRGLGSFIAGKGTLTGWHAAANAEAFANDATLEGALNAELQHSEHPTDTPRHSEENLATGQDPGFKNMRENASSSPKKSPTSTHKVVSSGDNSSGRIFSKAANIIRESFEVEGTVFLDVAMGSYRRPLISPTEKIHNVDRNSGHAPLSSSSDEQPHSSLDQVPEEARCGLLGFSNTDASSINEATPRSGNIGILPQRFLAKLLRRYPDGKIFNFDEIGELQTSDSSGDDYVRRRPHRSQEGAMIHQAFPGARSVAFLPIWDPKRERWLAGGFMYTLKPTRVFSNDSELTFLGAFVKLIAADVLNLETAQADKAKSDALGSLSHELRSPLHGVILSTDLLNDTNLSVFQGNAIHTIETCGRTLLDTIEHLLDYSKINSFAEKEVSSTPHNRGQRQRTKTDLFGKKSLSRHTRLDALVEDVVESAFAGFNFQLMSIRQLSKQKKSAHTDTAAHSRLDAEMAMEQLGPEINDDYGKLAVFKNTAVYITMDPSCNWLYYVQPGAIRRIVLNLLGNSLKYTKSGTIRVSLTQQQPARRSSNERLVKLVIHDTGKGMSEDYLRHKLFKPFSQEDELTPGTGLGLSLVKKITSQLHGHISVESKVGVGTTITVTLPLEETHSKLLHNPDFVDEDKEFKEQVRDLTNLRVSLRGFGSDWSKDGRALINEVCSRWLHLELVSGQDKIPDLILWSEDALPSSINDVAQLAKIPNVVVCRDALAAYQLLTTYENLGQDRVFEFMSQPLGPRALARALVLAYERWAGLPKLPIETRPPASTRAHSSCNDQCPAIEAVSENMAKMAPSEQLQVPVPASGRVGIGNAAKSKAETASVVDRQPDSNTAISPSSTTIRKLLLVDDNLVNLKVLSAYMKKLGQAYDAVTNGKEAVDAYTADPSAFAGILMDISMPVMDGLEATRQIRAHERRAQSKPVAILALTGLASDRVHQEALESGMDVFLTRPVGLSLLKEALGAQGLLPAEKADGDGP
ncbi:hypothetical protein NLU13_8125 [Sarocladium strictum]|uniref:histidine kinase n=1 Tax=Sarocladium strictum TaxID=5046 RepID=A0AA39GBE1_SARSR|nr:hypothetical protein NLU13_8125 [Sarocladium strictum]